MHTHTCTLIVSYIHIPHVKDVAMPYTQDTYQEYFRDTLIHTHITMKPYTCQLIRISQPQRHTRHTLFTQPCSMTTHWSMFTANCLNGGVYAGKTYCVPTVLIAINQQDVY